MNFKSGRFCSEAPTETGVDISSLLKVAAKADAAGEYEASIAALNAVSQNSKVLNRRSQGVQLFSAYAYFLCQMHLNDAIHKDDWFELLTHALNTVRPLIQTEIPLLHKRQLDKEEISEWLDMNDLLVKATKDSPSKDKPASDNTDTPE